MDRNSNRQRTFAAEASDGFDVPVDPATGSPLGYVQPETQFTGDDTLPFSGLMPPINAGEF